MSAKSRCASGCARSMPSMVAPSGSPLGLTITTNSSFLRSARLAGKAALQFGDAVERGARQWTLVDRGGGRFQVLHRRIPDQHGRDRVVGDHKAQRRLYQIVDMPVAHQRQQPTGALDIAFVAAAGADRIGRRRAERVALLTGAQRTTGENADV